MASAGQTARVAKDFARQVKAGHIVAFYGDLGSGKTLFIKALCKELGVPQEATSPSFTIINEYRAPQELMIYHFDFYRLKSTAELQNLGLDDFFYGGNICLVEWAEKISMYLPVPRWEIVLEFIPHQPDARHITIKLTDKSGS